MELKYMGEQTDEEELTELIAEFRLAMKEFKSRSITILGFALLANIILILIAVGMFIKWSTIPF